MTTQLLQSINAAHDLSFIQRLSAHSAAFLNKPYLNDANGEGEGGVVSTKPLWRMDAFDCVTYVNSVLALALANNAAQFKRWILLINYNQLPPTFVTRNHFMSLDWLAHAAKLGLVTDITTSLPIYKGAKAHAVIDKGAWFARKGVKAPQAPQAVSQAFIALEQMPAIPNLPQVALIAFIRHPQKPLKKIIGTDLLISHIGLLLHENNTIMLRHASSAADKVIELPLRTYFCQQKVQSLFQGYCVFRFNPVGLPT